MGKSWQSLVTELRHFYTVQKSIQGWHVPNRLKVVLEAERGEVSGTPHPPGVKDFFMLAWSCIFICLTLLHYIPPPPRANSYSTPPFVDSFSLITIVNAHTYKYDPLSVFGVLAGISSQGLHLVLCNHTGAHPMEDWPPISHQSSGGLKSSPIYTDMSTTIVFRYFLRDHSAETPWVRLL